VRYAPAYLNPAVLRWAREQVGLDVETAAAKASTTPELLHAAEHGEHHLSLRQAERAAEAYGVPIATLYLPEPPDAESIEQRFRHLRGVTFASRSYALVKLERDVRRRQEAMVDVYDSLGEDAPWTYVSETLGIGTQVPTAKTVRELLGIDPPALRAERLEDPYFSRKIVIRAVEWSGVLVTRQRVPDDGVRGFLLPHPEVPAIYVNSGEHPRAQTFTIVHEFAHLLIAHLGLGETEEEARCDAIAGEILMPGEVYEPMARRVGGSAVKRAQVLADQFGVTPLAAAVRGSYLDLFTAAEVSSVKNRARREPMPGTDGGGNGNRNKVSKLSPTFTDTVLAAADSASITLSAASRLLGTKVEDFDKLRDFVVEALGPRAAA
jgi:Zn-dependent peptidase ImmA (M78 family)/transcriptional regulator with XRE-family HTH domain